MAAHQSINQVYHHMTILFSYFSLICIHVLHSFLFFSVGKSSMTKCVHCTAHFIPYISFHKMMEFRWTNSNPIKSYHLAMENYVLTFSKHSLFYHTSFTNAADREIGKQCPICIGDISVCVLGTKDCSL